MKIQKTKKIFVTVPEELFFELRKRKALDDIDNTVTELLIDHFNIPVEE